MEKTFSVTVTELHEDDLETVIEEFTDLDGVTEEEACTRAEEIMFGIAEEGEPDSVYRIDVHDVDEDGPYIYETLWAKRSGE